MFYLGSDTLSRRVIENAHQERAQAFASFWAGLFGRKANTNASPARNRRAAA